MPSSTVLCSGCQQALTGRSAWQLGFPIAGWGMVYFAAVGFLLALDGPTLSGAAFAVAAVGVGASFVFATVLLLGQAPVCPLCLLVHATNLALFVWLWRIATRAVSFFRAGSHRRVVFAAAAMFAGGIFQSTVLLRSMQAARINARAVLDAYRSSPRQEISVDSEDPILGPMDGPVKLVVFSSFRCPACQSFSKLTQRLRNRFGNKLTVVFKHYPLSKVCNPALQRDLQPRSCEAAWAAQAAQRQQAFWPFHDGLFQSDLSASEQMLRQIAQATSLEVERWEGDRRSSGIQRKVKQDVELGAYLGVDGTPTLFLNGRRVQMRSASEIELLIASQIEESGARLSPGHRE